MVENIALFTEKYDGQQLFGAFDEMCMAHIHTQTHIFKPTNANGKIAIRMWQKIQIAKPTEPANGWKKNHLSDKENCCRRFNTQTRFNGHFIVHSTRRRRGFLLFVFFSRCSW